MPRTELGLVSTECSCAECTKVCYTMPGYLLETDIDRIWKKVAPQMTRSQFITSYLKPGRGARLVEGRPDDIQFVQYQTMVPARTSDGKHCIFLKDNKCTIHDVSPFGCAFYDSHMGRIEENVRDRIGLSNVKESLQKDGLFSMVLLKLFGIKKHDQMKNVTKVLWPNGVPEKYKELALYIQAEAAKRGLRIYQDPNKVIGKTGK